MYLVGLENYPRHCFTDISRRAPAPTHAFDPFLPQRLGEGAVAFHLPSSSVGFHVEPVALLTKQLSDGDRSHRVALVSHHLLVFPESLQEGAVYQLSAASLDSPLEWEFSRLSARCHSLKVNQDGYYSSSAAYAVYGEWHAGLETIPASPASIQFAVHEEGTFATVLKGGSSGSHTGMADYGEPSSLRLPLDGLPRGGPYFISVEGVGRSDSFFVGRSLEAGWHMVRGLYHQRCGVALQTPFTNFTRCSCHNDVQVTDAEPPGFILDYSCPAGCQKEPFRNISGG